MPYFDNRDIETKLTTLTTDDISGTTGLIEPDVIVVDLGDTTVSQSQFQGALQEAGEDAYVLKMTQTYAHMKHCFPGYNLDNAPSIVSDLQDAFAVNTGGLTHVCNAMSIPVVDNDSSSTVLNGFKSIVSDTLEMQLDEIDDALVNERFVDWIIPTLFGGSIYGVVDFDDESDNNITNLSGKVSKDKFIKRALMNIGFHDASGNVIDSALLTNIGNKRIIFKARLIDAGTPLKTSSVPTNKLANEAHGTTGDRSLPATEDRSARVVSSVAGQLRAVRLLFDFRMNT